MTHHEHAAEPRIPEFRLGPKAASVERISGVVGGLGLLLCVAGFFANRAQFFRDLPSGPFYGYNRPGANVSPGVIDNWWRQGMMGGAKAHYDCIKAFSETDFTKDLERIDVPTLIMHGDDDQIVPIGASALRSAELVRGSTLKVYKGFPHGMATTHADVINADLLAFFKA